MAVKLPLVISSGEHQQLQSGDTYPFGHILTSGSISSAATFTLDLTPYYANYDEFEFRWLNWRPVTAAVDLWLRVSSDGSTYDSGAGTYEWTANYSVTTGATTGATGLNTGNASNSDTKLVLAQSCDNTTSSCTSGYIRLFNPNSATFRVAIRGAGLTIGASQAMIGQEYQGQRKAAQQTKAIQLLFSSGNISTGKWKLIGFQNS